MTNVFDVLKERGFIAANTAADFDNDIFPIMRVARKKEEEQFFFKRRFFRH